MNAVKRASEYWKYVPYLGKVRGLLFLNRIYLRSDIYDDVHSSSPSVMNISVLVHEQTHYERMQKQGMLRFGIKYLFSSKARFEEELAAIVEQMKYLKSKGEQYDIERTAKALASVYYLWCTSYQSAVQRLTVEWDDI
jgi:K+/H+ antiporter YhaU regulatory subunit KhtT